MEERLFGPLSNDEFLSTEGLMRKAILKTFKYKDALKILRAEMLAARFEKYVFTMVVPTKGRRKDALKRFADAQKEYANYTKQWKKKAKGEDFDAFQTEIDEELKKAFSARE